MFPNQCKHTIRLSLTWCWQIWKDPPSFCNDANFCPRSHPNYFKMYINMLDCVCSKDITIKQVKNLLKLLFSWWRHQMETFSALLDLCAGNSPVTGEFPSQRPVTRSLDIFFDLHLNKRLSKQSWGWWIETPSRSLWRHCNVQLSSWQGSHKWSRTRQCHKTYVNWYLPRSTFAALIFFLLCIFIIIDPF